MSPDGNQSNVAHHLRWRDLLRLSLRVFHTRPTRTLLTILGISLGVGIVLFLVSLGYGLQYTLLGRLVTTQDSLITIEAYYPPDSGLTVSGATMDKVRADANVGAVSPVAEFPAEFDPVAVAPAPATVAEPGATTTLNSGFLFARIVKDDYFRLSGVVPDLGEIPASGKEGIVVSSAALKIVGLPYDTTSLGKQFTITALYADKEGSTTVARAVAPASIVGVVQDDVDPPFLIASDALFPVPPPTYERMLVKALDASVIEKVRDLLINMGFLVSTHIDLVNQANKIMSIVTAILGVFGITALIVSAIGMFNTMIISFLERTFEVGIMKAIGATNRDIRDLFLAESLVMGVAGGLGGVLIGTLLGEGANLGLNILAETFGGKPVSLFIRPIWFQVLIVAVSGFIGIVSGSVPARRASSISPKEAFIRK